jgi:hypothetical protein
MASAVAGDGIARVSFPYFLALPVVEVEFAHASGSGTVARRLLVDSGFTGQSAFALPLADEAALRWRQALESTVRGAMAGPQRRVWTICLLPALRFRRRLLAICADLDPVALPPGIGGPAGLTFLHGFTRWSGERRPDGAWQFVLEAA